MTEYRNRNAILSRQPAIYASPERNPHLHCHPNANHRQPRQANGSQHHTPSAATTEAVSAALSPAGARPQRPGAPRGSRHPPCTSAADRAHPDVSDLLERQSDASPPECTRIACTTRGFRRSNRQRRASQSPFRRPPSVQDSSPSHKPECGKCCKVRRSRWRRPRKRATCSRFLAPRNYRRGRHLGIDAW